MLLAAAVIILTALLGHFRIIPQIAQQHFSKGIALQQTGEHQQAILAFTKAIDLREKCPQFYLQRGISLATLGQQEMAIADYNRAANLGLQSPQLLLYRAIAMRQQGKINEALTDLDAAIAQCDSSLRPTTSAG